MEVQSNITSNNNSSAERSLSVADSSKVIKKHKSLIDNKKLKKIIFPNKKLENKVFEDKAIFSENLKKYIPEYRKHEKLCDVTLIAGDKKFNVHRIVLAVMIPYFESMFGNNMIESNVKEITLHEFDADLIETFINYAYGDVISINKDNAEDILMAASFFQLDKIVDLCAKFFIHHFDPSNILYCYFIAASINCQHMKTEALNYINKYFSEILEQDSFLELSYDTVKEIISSNNVDIKNESKIFETIIRWVKHAPEERSKHMFSLLNCIRLLLLEPNYLITRVAEEELVVNNPECRKLVDEAKNCLIVPERKDKFENSKLEQRSYNEKPLLFAVRIDTATANKPQEKSMMVYNCNKIWEILEHSNFENKFLSCIASDQTLLYTVSHCREENYKNHIEVYDIALKTSKVISPILHERHLVGVAVLNGFLYVCGGIDTSSPVLSKRSPTGTVQRYCPTNDKWELLTPMKIPRARPEVVACGEYLYVIGGRTTKRNKINLMEKFNPVTGEWSDQILVGKSFATSLHGKIYAIGRKQENVSAVPNVKVNTFDVYDPHTKIWSPLAPLNETGVLSLVSNKNNLWAIGKDFVAVYDTTSNTWSLDRSIQLFPNTHYVIV